jgi:hypothetical protein
MVDLKKDIVIGAALKHVATADRSAPVIEPNVKIGENARPALLNELISKTSAGA